MSLELHQQIYNWVLISMSVCGLLCFIALYFVKAGYGKFLDKSWGLAFNGSADANCYADYDYSLATKRQYDSLDYCRVLYRALCAADSRVSVFDERQKQNASTDCIYGCIF